MSEVENSIDKVVPGVGPRLLTSDVTAKEMVADLQPKAVPGKSFQARQLPSTECTLTLKSLATPVTTASAAHDAPGNVACGGIAQSEAGGHSAMQAAPMVMRTRIVMSNVEVRGTARQASQGLVATMLLLAPAGPGWPAVACPFHR